jgi:hypothetical protein
VIVGVVRLQHIRTWDCVVDVEEQDELLRSLEEGQVLLFEHLEFPLSRAEQRLLAPEVSNGRSKNISVDPTGSRVSGTDLEGAQLETLRRMVRRFSRQAHDLLERVLPHYSGQLETRLASYRPLDIESRASSSRKDDTRLHVDAFASRPSQGRRILRVFCNVNPENKPRTWLLGEAFEPYARRFSPSVRDQLPLEAAALQALGITKSQRTRYDHLMLGMHDHGKLDETYQRNAARERFDFPAGSTWVCFTDQVVHAATGGQYLLEQTFLLPVSAMLHPEGSPLQLLERMTGRQLL